jgi:hypothetical protein
MMTASDIKALWEVLVPATMDGKPVPVSYHQKWDEKVRQISGGLTILKTVKGQWLSLENELFVEPMIPVRIFCNRPQINKILDFTADHYRQLAVMCYRISDEVIIKDYGNSNS